MNKYPHDLPKVARPVLNIIRRDVPRPSNEIRYVTYSPEDSSHIRFEKAFEWCCPMGLHPDSTYHVPVHRHQFAGGRCSDLAVEAFGNWWDKKRNVKKAIEAVWGKEKKCTYTKK